MHRVLIDPTTEPIGDKLQTFRVRLIALIDGLPEWSGLDRWLTTEHLLGVAISREVMEKARPEFGVEEHLNLLAPHRDWGMALAQNLRQLRNIGYCPADIASLRAHALDALTGVYRRNQWGAPPLELAQDPGR